jgi:hypothetical protein
MKLTLVSRLEFIKPSDENKKLKVAIMTKIFIPALARVRKQY